MNTFLSDLRATIIPGADARQGPLPPMLLIMTVVTGLVDSFSFLKLGHVFVANSTGNILFMGFALAHVPGFSVVESLLALAATLVGAFVGGKLCSAFVGHRGKILGVSTSVEAVFVAIAVVLSLVASTPVHGVYRTLFVAVLGVAMGVQNAAARKIAVPDLTTTVLTMTITGIGADGVLAGGKGSRTGRRLVPIIAMLLGAVIGALLELHAALCTPLITALVLMLVVVGWVTMASRTDGAWQTSS
jgi:uncharacterized membrane protein YoaK (UPF0700 family)